MITQNSLMFLRITWLLAAWLAGGTFAQACDACGCSIIFMDMGLTPRFDRHQLAWQGQYQAFRSFATDTELRNGTVGSRERYFQQTLQGVVSLHERWQLTLAVPYLWRARETGGLRDEAHGLADASALARYTPWRRLATDERPFGHRLSLGIGVKAPTGRRSAAAEGVSNPNFQQGSGSWDGLAHIQYVLRYQQWGLAADALMSFNGTNEEDYQYGHRRGGHILAFRIVQVGRTGLMPSAGCYFEGAGRDVQRGFYRNDTGGHYLFAQLGVQWFIGELGVSAQTQLPLQQNWGGGLTEAQSRWSLQFTYFL